MTSDMNILHVIESLAPQRGGPPQVCANLVASQSVNHPVTVASYSNDKEARQIIDFGGNVDLIQVAPTPLERILGSESRKILREHVINSDMVHLHNAWESILVSAAKLSNENNVKYCITPHGMLDPWSLSQKKWKKKIALMLGRKSMFERATFIHALNETEYAGFRNLGLKNRCEIIPNGVDLDSIDPALSPIWFDQQFPKLNGKPFVLFLSRLHYKKGLDILADCADHFFSTSPDWHWVIAGPDGGARESFESKIAVQGRQENVHVIGPVYGKQKFSLLSAASMFCLPSRQEGFSIAILEAMAAGLPVCITENCHFAEVGSEGCGKVTTLDSEAFTKGLVELALCEKTRRQMGHNARRLVESKYTWKKISHQFIEKMKS